ncbi:hypothetical protein CBP22_05565, partial [Fischerella thermalis WC249]
LLQEQVFHKASYFKQRIQSEASYIFILYILRAIQKKKKSRSYSPLTKLNQVLQHTTTHN